MDYKVEIHRDGMPEYVTGLKCPHCGANHDHLEKRDDIWHTTIGSKKAKYVFECMRCLCLFQVESGPNPGSPG